MVLHSSALFRNIISFPTSTQVFKGLETFRTAQEPHTPASQGDLLSSPFTNIFRVHKPLTSLKYKIL